MGALRNTLELAIFAIPISFALGATLGTVAGCVEPGPVGRTIDRLVTGTAVLGVSVPNYWLGLVMVIIFAVEVSWLPASGMGNNGSDNFSAFNLDDLRYLVLPVITLSMVPVGIIARTTRAAVLEVRGQGLRHNAPRQGPRRSRRHPPRAEERRPGMLAVMGLQFGYLMGGSILVEPVFAWPAPAPF